MYSSKFISSLFLKAIFNILNNCSWDSTLSSNLSSTNKKDQDLTNINNNIPQNKLTKTKSGLFLNNFFRTNKRNGKKKKSSKKSSKNIKKIKKLKKKKKEK